MGMEDVKGAMVPVSLRVELHCNALEQHRTLFT